MSSSTAPQTQEPPSAGSGSPLVTIYWLEVSRATRVLWLCEELKIPYKLETFKRGSDKLAPPELRQIHPLGKAPIISVKRPDSDQHIVLAESAAIVEYLVDHWGPSMIPTRYKSGFEGQIGGETESWIRNRYFMHYAEGSLFAHNVVGIITQGIKNAPVPFFLKPFTSAIAGQVTSKYLQPNYERHLSFLSDQLETSPDQGQFLCGKDIAPADFMMEFAVDVAMQLSGIDGEKHPRLKQYVDRLRERDGYKSAVKKIEEVEGRFKTKL